MAFSFSIFSGRPHAERRDGRLVHDPWDGWAIYTFGKQAVGGRVAWSVEGRATAPLKVAMGVPAFWG